MVIWPAFRMGQHKVKDHPYHAPLFMVPRLNSEELELELFKLNSEKF